MHFKSGYACMHHVMYQNLIYRYSIILSKVQSALFFQN